MAHAVVWATHGRGTLAFVEDEGDELERRRLTKTRDQLSDLLARIDEAQRQADEAHRDAEEALRRFEGGE